MGVFNVRRCKKVIKNKLLDNPFFHEVFVILMEITFRKTGVSPIKEGSGAGFAQPSRLPKGAA